jgi:TPP-dependent pyruvate/acetoin dehydrogenase alpha subunit
MLADMIRIRVMEERCAELYGQMKIRGFLHLYIGEEAIAAAVIPQLEPDDSVLATYREHGHALMRGVAAERIMAEMFGKASGCSGGRGGSMHPWPWGWLWPIRCCGDRGGSPPASSVRELWPKVSSTKP